MSFLTSLIAVPMNSDYRENLNDKDNIETPDSANTTVTRRSERKARKTHESLRNFCSSDEDNEETEYIPEKNKSDVHVSS